MDPRQAELTSVIVATSGLSHTATSPFPGHTIDAVPLSSADDVATAVAAASGIQAKWAGLSPRSRAQVLARVHDLLLSDHDAILDAIQVETGKEIGRAHV